MEFTLPSIKQQLKTNIVAIASVLVAMSGLAYNTWRNEKTEINRNVRVASFEMLKTLGELQVTVDYAHYKQDMERGDLTVGWGRVLYIRDLAQIAPQPIPEQTENLVTSWRENTDKLMTDACGSRCRKWSRGCAKHAGGWSE